MPYWACQAALRSPARSLLVLRPRQCACVTEQGSVSVLFVARMRTDAVPGFGDKPRRYTRTCLYSSGRFVFSGKAPSLLTFCVQPLYSLCSRLCLSTAAAKLHSLPASRAVKHACSIQGCSALHISRSPVLSQRDSHVGSSRVRVWGLAESSGGFYNNNSLHSSSKDPSP